MQMTRWLFSFSLLVSKVKSFLSIQPSLYCLLTVHFLNTLLGIMLASIWGFPIHVTGNICSVGANNLSERCMKKQANVFTNVFLMQAKELGGTSEWRARQGGWAPGWLLCSKCSGPRSHPARRRVLGSCPGPWPLPFPHRPPGETEAPPLVSDPASVSPSAPPLP